MEYLLELTFLVSLAHDLKSAEVAAILQTGMAYKDLSLLMALALFAMVFADQLAMIRGKFSGSANVTATSKPLVKKQPFQQFFKNQMFAGFMNQTSYLRGAEQMGQLKFFAYNLLASGSWLFMLLILGSGLRALWVEFFGSFAPIEVELITAILAVYLMMLVYTLIKR